MVRLSTILQLNSHRSVTWKADEAEGIDGYTSTPGGRFWYVDGTELVVSQICGVGCMIQDSNFEVGLDGCIEVSYSIEEMRGLWLSQS